MLQKVAAEDDLPAVVTCLQQVYGGGDDARQTLRAAETQVLDACGLDLAWCARALGLDRPERTGAGISIGPPRSAGTAPPDLTVVVPSYRHSPYIETTIASVLAQTYAAFTVRVVDDRSPDDTVARARAVGDRRVRVEVNAANLGLGDSVLNALDAVDTPFVALLNSDNLFHPERLERCRAAFEQSPHAQVVATGFVNIDAEGRTLTVDTVRRLFDGRQIADWVQWQADTGHVEPDGDLVAALLERNFLVTSSNIVARTDFLRHHAEALRGLKYCLDWQVFLDAAAADALVVLPEPLLGYRLHGSNTVWFDDVARKAYELEVNRVIAEALRRRRARAAIGADDDGDLAHLLEQLVHHAAQHSDASGVAMYANALVGSRRLEAAVPARPWCMHRCAPLTDHRCGQCQPADDTLALAARGILEEWLSRGAARPAALRDRGDGLERATAARAERDRAAALLARVSARRPDLESGWRLPDWRADGEGATHVSRPSQPAEPSARPPRLLSRPGQTAGGRRCVLELPHPLADLRLPGNAGAGVGRVRLPRVLLRHQPKHELPAAFSGLWNQRLVMQTDWYANQRDLEHFPPHAS